MYTYTYLHTHTHTYTHAYTHTHIHACIHTYIHTDRHTYIHTQKHTQTSTYKHTCMHQEELETQELPNVEGGAGGICFDYRRTRKMTCMGKKLTYYLLSLLPIINNAYYPEICLKQPLVAMVFWAHFFRKLVSRPMLVPIYAERGGAPQPAVFCPRLRRSVSQRPGPMSICDFGGFPVCTGTS